MSTYGGRFMKVESGTFRICSTHFNEKVVSRDNVEHDL